MIHRCLQENCNGTLDISNRILLTYPVQYQYRCIECNHRYLKTDGKDNLHSHFDQKYGGD